MRRTSLRVPPREARCRQHARRAPSAACTSPNAPETRIVVSRRRVGSMEGEMWCGPLINDHAKPRLIDDHDAEQNLTSLSASSTSHSRALTSPRTHGRAPPEPFTIICERTPIAEAGLDLFLFFVLPMPLYRGISCTSVHFATQSASARRSPPRPATARVGITIARAACEGDSAHQPAQGVPRAAPPTSRLQQEGWLPSGCRQQEIVVSWFLNWSPRAPGARSS